MGKKRKKRKDYQELKRDIEEKLLEQADVILTTCNSSWNRLLDGRKFKYVIIDEATQATEPDCLLPALKGCEKLILVGD